MAGVRAQLRTPHVQQNMRAALLFMALFARHVGAFLGGSSTGPREALPRHQPYSQMMRTTRAERFAARQVIASMDSGDAEGGAPSADSEPPRSVQGLIDQVGRIYRPVSWCNFPHAMWRMVFIWYGPCTQ